MKLPRLSRRDDDAVAPSTTGGSPLGLDDWEGRWPEDDTVGHDGADPQVPMLLNPNSPNIAPGAG